MEEDRDRRNYPIEKLAGDITADVIKLWRKANDLFQPPVIFAERSIERKISVAWKAAVEIANGKKKESQKNTFQEKLDYLLDIASCSCNIILCEEANCPGCSDRVHCVCKCSREKKIPKMELAFMKSMRERRPPGKRARMMMSYDDKEET